MLLSVLSAECLRISHCWRNLLGQSPSLPRIRKVCFIHTLIVEPEQSYRDVVFLSLQVCKPGRQGPAETSSGAALQLSGQRQSQFDEHHPSAPQISSGNMRGIFYLINGKENRATKTFLCIMYHYICSKSFVHDRVPNRFFQARLSESNHSRGFHINLIKKSFSSSQLRRK